MNKEKEEICYLCLNKGYIDKTDILRLNMEGVIDQEDCNCKFSLNYKIKHLSEEKMEELVEHFDNGKMVRGFEKLMKWDEERKKKKTQLIIKSVFITLLLPTMYILYSHFDIEKEITFNGIMASFAMSSVLLGMLYGIVFRIFIGKIDTSDYRYGDWFFFWIPVLLFGVVIGLIITLLESFNFFNNDLVFLILYAKYTRLIFIFIIAYFITKKIYWFVFNKKNNVSDSNNEK